MEDEGKLLSNKNDEIEELTQALDLLNDEINTLVELLERRGILTNQRSLMISCSNADGWCKMNANDSHGRFEVSVNLFVDPTQKAQVIYALEKVENIEEIYDVKGEFDIVSIVSASSMEEFHDVLKKKIMKIRGVQSIITSVVLKTYKQPKSTLGNIHTR